MGTGKSKSNSQKQQQGKPLSDSKKKHVGPRLMQAQVRRQQQINNLLSVTSVMDTIHRNNNLPIGRWLALSIRRCDGILGGGICGSCLSGTTVLSSTTTTLAQATVRRLFWPEHLRCERLPHLRRYSNWLLQHCVRVVDVQIQVPVEHVVMVGRKLRIGSGSNIMSNNNDNGGETNELRMSWA